MTRTSSPLVVHGFQCTPGRPFRWIKDKTRDRNYRITRFTRAERLIFATDESNRNAITEQATGLVTGGHMKGHSHQIIATRAMQDYRRPGIRRHWLQSDGLMFRLRDDLKATNHLRGSVVGGGVFGCGLYGWWIRTNWHTHMYARYVSRWPDSTRPKYAWNEEISSFWNQESAQLGWINAGVGLAGMVPKKKPERTPLG